MIIGKDGIKKLIKSWTFWLGLFAIVLTIAMCVVLFFTDVDFSSFVNYGYAGSFLISIIGGAISVIPVPMMIVQFSLGAVVDPFWGPRILAPLCVGLVSGIGEGVGCMATYYTGVSGSMALNASKEDLEKETSRLKRWTNKIIGMMGRRGELVVFLLASFPNPFYYPIAIAAGAMKYSKKKFLIMSVLGKIIKSSFFAYCGYFGLTFVLK